MKPTVSLSTLSLGIWLAGCAAGASPAVQPVAITSSDFCRTMKAIMPPSGKPSWSVDDTAQTRTDARKIGSAVDAKCAAPRPTAGS